MIPKIAARTGKILLGQIKPWRSAHVTGERGAPCRLPSASRVSRQCHNRGAVGQSKHRILLPLKAISSGKKKKKRRKKLTWNLAVSAANSAGQERWLQPRNRNYHTFHNTQFPRDFISFMGFPFSLSTASASKALSDSMTVYLVCYHQNKTKQPTKKNPNPKTFSLSNHWNLFSLSCNHMPDTFSFLYFFYIYPIC